MDTYYTWRNTSFYEPPPGNEYSWSYDPEPEPREYFQDVFGQFNTLAQSFGETSSDIVRSSEEALASSERLGRELDEILRNLHKTPEEPPEEQKFEQAQTITTRCDDKVDLIDYYSITNKLISFLDHSQEKEMAVPSPHNETISASDPFKKLQDDFCWSDDEDDIPAEVHSPQSEPIQTEINMAIPCQDKAEVVIPPTTEEEDELYFPPSDNILPNGMPPKEEMEIPFPCAPVKEAPVNDIHPTQPSWYDGWFSDDEDDFEPEMEIPSPHVDVSDDEDMNLEDLFGDFIQEEDEMAIPSPKEDSIEDPIEAKIQAFFNAKDDGEPICNDGQDPEESLKELESILHEDHLMCVSSLPVPKEKSLDGLQTTPPPLTRQTGKFPNFFIFKIPVGTELVSLGLNSVLHLHNKLGLRNWKTTKKKFNFKITFYFFVVTSTPPLVKARNKFGKGNFDVPFDNG